MGFLRNVVTDLVEKRLWPVALLLIVALAAVPVLLGRGAEPEPAITAAAPATPAPAPAARAQIAVDVPVAANRERKGKLRNPFKQRGAKAAAASTATATATAPSTPAPDAGAPSAAGPPADSGTPSTGSTPPPAITPSEPAKPDAGTPRTDPLDSYRIALRFGRTGKVRTRRDVARLTPLPTVDDPFFVFLGVLEGGERAVFLVSAEAKPTGDGICKPRPSSCQTIEMRVGDTQFFDLERAEGPVQYELQLLSIRREAAGSPSEAVAARTRASKAGAEVLQEAEPDAVDGIDGYRFSRRTGLLERTPVASRASADDADGADADPDGADADLDAAPAAPAAASPEPATATAAVAQAAVADAAETVRRQDKRTRAAVRAIVRGVGRALSSLR